MGAFLATLAIIAGTYLLDQASTAIKDARSRVQGLSSEQIISLIGKMINEAKTKGENVVSEVTERLGNIQTPVGMSSSVKDYITNVKSKISTDLKRKREQLTDIENKASNLQQRADILANQTNEYKYFHGEDDLARLKKEAGNLITSSQNLSKGVEQHV